MTIEQIYGKNEIVVSFFDQGLITVEMIPGNELLRLYSRENPYGEVFYLWEFKEIRSISFEESFNPVNARTWYEVEVEVQKWIKEVSRYDSVDKYLHEEAISIISGEYGPVE